MKLFRVRGISVELHPTFYLLPIYVAWQGWADERWRGVAEQLLELFLIYASVVLHEFGHALTAQRLRVPVRHIVLTPIGGMALFDWLPRKPMKELLIIAAGPAVNFAIAAICVFLLGGWPAHLMDYTEPALNAGDMLRFLLLSNLALGCFNLIPAFPMDGGRIVRALLAFNLGYVPATRYAVIIGRWTAAVGIALGFMAHSPVLVVLFAFILVIGTWEYHHVLAQEAQR